MIGFVGLGAMGKGMAMNMLKSGDELLVYDIVTVSFPEFLDVLYGNVAGVIIMSICLLVYLVAYEMGRRIVEIEV